MFCVSIALGNTAWRLMFKDEAKAKVTFESLRPLQIAEKSTTIEDDYGQVCCITNASIHGLMLEDLDKAKLANVELFLHQQRVQVMANKAAAADPGLRTSSVMNGPAVYQPGGLRQ